MSSSSRTLSGIHAALDRIGLEVIKDKEENSIFSPLGAALAVGLLVYVYDNPPPELWDWLGVDRDTSDPDFADSLKVLGDEFKSRKENALFWEYAVYRGARLSDRCVEYVKKRMGVPIFVTDFPSPGETVINQAVEKVTRGKITQVLSGVNPRSRLPISAVYLNRFWRTALPLMKTFDWLLPGSSHPATFVGGECELKYASTSSYHYLALPYSDGSEMEIYMTKSRSRLPTELSVDDMSVLRDRAKPWKTCLYIPKWEYDYERNVLSDLTKAGVVFPNSPDMVAVQQKAHILVDGNRTEAAAVTFAICEDSARPDPFYFREFKVDRPFIYTIRSGEVTEFMGYLYDIGQVRGVGRVPGRKSVPGRESGPSRVSVPSRESVPGREPVPVEPSGSRWCDVA